MKIEEPAEKPFHVKVAEALGCKPRYCPTMDIKDSDWCCNCPGYPHEAGHDRDSCELARYDTDWFAVGPVFETLGTVGHNMGLQCENGGHWLAWKCDLGKADPLESYQGRGATATVAICNLILALRAAGKLEEIR